MRSTMSPVRWQMGVLAAGAAWIALWGPAGCSVGSGTGPYAPQAETARDPQEAQRLTLLAAEKSASAPKEAEKLLRQALTADLYHGPAHNNLGVLYLKQGELYQAAGEFEWARKLMPGHPDPRMNLALTLEKAGRTSEALDTYRTALEVYPGHIQSIQALARLQVRAGRTDDKTEGYLDEIALRGTTQEWRQWARAEMARRPAASP